jgi:hypothetical protein
MRSCVAGDGAGEGVMASSTPELSTFKPSSVVATTLDDLVTKIKAEFTAMKEAARNVVRRAIAVGEYLNQAKAKVEHGKWGQWLKDNFGMTDRSAQRYMKLADNKQRIEDHIRKTDTVSDLSFNKAMGLIKSSSEGSGKSDGKRNGSGSGANPEADSASNDEEEPITAKADVVGNLTEELVVALKAWKKEEPVRAIETASNLVRRLRDADLIDN